MEDKPLPPLMDEDARRAQPLVNEDPDAKPKPLSRQSRRKMERMLDKAQSALQDPKSESNKQASLERRRASGAPVLTRAQRRAIMSKYK